MSLNPEDWKPSIAISNKSVPEIAEEAWNALEMDNYPAYIFQFGSELVRIHRNNDSGISFEPVSKNRFRHIISRTAKWTNGRLLYLPPVNVINDMLAQGYGQRRCKAFISRTCLE